MRRSAIKNRAGRGVRVAKRMPRNKPRPNYLRLFLMFVVSCAVTGAVAYAVRTPSLSVKAVTIRGVRLCDAGAVRRLSERALGQNILLLRKSPILREIDKISEVKSATMGRSFPRGIWVKVRERRPDAVITDGTKFCLAEADGFAFHEVSGPQKGLALLAVSGCNVRIGTRVRSANVQSALDVLRRARAQRIEVNKISIDPEGDICLNMSGGFYVKLGQPDEIPGKIALLRRAISFKPSIVKEAEYIDVSCLSAAVWKPKKDNG